MVVGVMQFEVIVPWSQSLKDKRRVVRSLRDRLHREHLVSVAEVGGLGEHRRALLGMAIVSNSARHASMIMDRTLAKVRALHDAELGTVSREVLHAGAIEWRSTDDDPESIGRIWTDEEILQAEREAAAEAEAGER